MPKRGNPYRDSKGRFSGRGGRTLQALYKTPQTRNLKTIEMKGRKGVFIGKLLPHRPGLRKRPAGTRIAPRSVSYVGRYITPRGSHRSVRARIHAGRGGTKVSLRGIKVSLRRHRRGSGWV